jgi:hypothetical protein
MPTCKKCKRYFKKLEWSVFCKICYETEIREIKRESKFRWLLWKEERNCQPTTTDGGEQP